MKKFGDLFYVDIALGRIKSFIKGFDSMKSVMTLVKRMQANEDYMACLEAKNNILADNLGLVGTDYDREALAELLAKEIDGLDDLSLIISLPEDAPMTFQDIEILDQVLSQFTIMKEGTSDILYNNNLQS